MKRCFWTVFAVGSLVFAGACSARTESVANASATTPAVANATNTPAAAPPVAQSAAAPKPAETPQAVPAVAAEPPQRIVVPPRPKPGAPHGPGFDMPLIDVGEYAPPRPMDVLKDAHIFTADHPEVATYIPCYCGCGSMGHKNNADCFVASRDAEGKVTAWVPHGAACAVCIDIAVESMRMRNSGASVSAIRTQIQSEYRPRFPTSETPTPPPPTNH
ncbi:MAG TPA: PCYCGC motif-containing (lipo)protein [Vicinamibacterales bacterium]|jgi:hypothetical protein|nr:PCYCGC motif-containing (lipo)protein [Vicinamibacterales bacterium]